MKKDAIVLYPAPGIGHSVSMIELAKHICRRHGHCFTITILVTTGPFSTYASTEAFISRASESNPSISFLYLPSVPVDKSPTRSHAAIAFESIRLCDPKVLDTLKEISKSSKIRAFIIDLFCTSAVEATKELQIPTYQFFTSGSSALAAFLYLPILHNEVSKSFKDMDDTVLRLPGLPPLPATQMPEPLLDRNDAAYSDMIQMVDHLPRSSGILTNTFDALEPAALGAITQGLCRPDMPVPRIYNIGPLIVTKENANSSKNGEEERNGCLKWLDCQPSQSVVFLCFGSRGVFTAAQTKEMAKGLESCGNRFLWVARDPIDGELEKVLPERFAENTRDRGLLVKNWAPQIDVLNHDSVVGFVTHCGWNSTLEAVVAGISLIAWPLYAEQHLNKAALVEDMNMALEVKQREGDGLVTGDELAKRVHELMDSEEGRELRVRSQMMRQKALEAWDEGGSSSVALDQLVHIWLK